MRHRCFFIFAASVFVCTPVVYAQQIYTDHLQKQIDGKGRILIYQDSELSRLVNNSTQSPQIIHQAEKEKIHKEKTHGSETNNKPKDTTGIVHEDVDEIPDIPVIKKKVRAQGYRIQLYAGGSSRVSRQEAMSVGRRFKSQFPMLSVYTHFTPPRWICRAGDFRTYEEARQQLQEVRETRMFKEATIVKTQILVTY